MAFGSAQMLIQIYISLTLLCFLLGNAALLSTITFVAMLLYSFVRCNLFGNAFRSNTECHGEISYAFRNNAGTGLQGKVILFKCL